MSFREFPIATFIYRGIRGVFGFYIESHHFQRFFTARFSMGCKKAGYVGNATRLWAAINQAGGHHLGGDYPFPLILNATPPTNGSNSLEIPY